MRIRKYATSAALTLAAAFILLGVPAWAGSSDNSFRARVVHVADGDTIEVVRQGDKMDMLKIRFYGVDAPESGQAYGNQAARYLRAKINKALVTVEVKQKRDRYGRIVAVVKTDQGQDVASLMAKAGYVWVDPRFCKSDRVCRVYRAGVDQARKNKAGLWRDKEPVPPWEWRQ